MYFQTHMKVHARKRKLEARALLTAKIEPSGGDGGEGIVSKEGNNASNEENTKDTDLTLDNISKMLFSFEILYTYTLNKKLVEVSHMGIKGGSSLVNRLVD